MRLGRDFLLKIAGQAVEMSLDQGAQKAFALIKITRENLTRYSNNSIENSTSQYMPSLYLKIENGGRIASGTIGDFGEQNLARLVYSLVHAAKAAGPGSNTLSLAPRAADYPALDSFDPATAQMTARERADLVRRICAKAEGRSDVRLFGNAVSGFEETALANSDGVRAYFCGSVARLQATAIADTLGAGMQRHIGRSMKDADPEKLSQGALFRAGYYPSFVDVAPGDYEVILEPSAAGELMHHLSYLGFDGLGHLRGNSCYAGQLGEQIMSPLVSISDDSLRADNLSSTFDWEGTPKKRLGLVQNGVLKTPVYDFMTAQEAGLKSTGHGLPPEGEWFTEGPFPTHLVLEPGHSSPEDLVSNVKRGISITAFHYTRPLDPKRAVITGMTRNGTFLIEDGKIVGMLPNLRFAVSAVTIMKNVLEVANNLTLAGDYNPHLVPSVRVHGFSITGKTEN